MNALQRYFVVMYFDGTLAATFDRSPNGMDVKLAYELAIREVFGQTGLRIYQDGGGLKNREPGEIVKSILHSLGSYSVDETRIATEILVEKKLSHLTPEISEQWPRLYPGVKEFFGQVNSGTSHIDTGIVSSGHDDFIKAVFRINDIVPPDILVTSDILRSRKRSEVESCKPHTYQMAEAHRQWHKTSLNGQFTNNGESRNHGKPYMVYVGDDPVKDAGLAERARIPFLFVPFTHPDFHPDPEKGQMAISDFSQLTEMLQERDQELREGKSFSSILLRKSDSELFPPKPNPELSTTQAKTESASTYSLLRERRI